MPTYCAFLRAINVGGRTVKMADLRDLFAEIGLPDTQTLIASGNAVFESRRKPENSEAMIEKAMAKRYGFEVPTIIRSLSDLARINVLQPFPDRKEGQGAIYVGFLKEAPSKEAKAALATHESDLDALTVIGREAWWWVRTKQSDSDLTGPKVEKILGVTGTFRNLNTVGRLLGKFGS